MLNNWVGFVMQAYPSLPAQAQVRRPTDSGACSHCFTLCQNVINTFFSLASNIPSDAHYEVFLQM